MFDGVKVTIDGGLSVVATLEFFQHDLAEMGHRETSFLCTQTRSPTSRTAGSMTRDSVRRTSDLVQVGFGEIAIHFPEARLWTASVLWTSRPVDECKCDITIATPKPWAEGQSAAIMARC